MKQIKFKETSEIKEFLKHNDLYNKILRIYVFEAEKNDLRYCILTNEEAQRTADKARKADSRWCDVLNTGGFTIDNYSSQEFFNDTLNINGWYIADHSYGQRTYKLHARVTREIEINQDELGKLLDYLSGKAPAGNRDIGQLFIKGITTGKYENGYIPYNWLEDDLKEAGINISEHVIYDKEGIDIKL